MKRRQHQEADVRLSIDFLTEYCLERFSTAWTYFDF